MKTNTNTLRCALETFAKTGKITLTASALMALALTAAPADAKSITDTLVDRDTVTIEQNTTVTSPVTIPENLTITGNAPSTTLSGNETNAILIAPKAASSLTLKNLTFDSGIGYLPEGEGTRGGAIYGGKLTIDTDNVTFENSSVDQFGGAIASESSMTLTGSSIFTNNTSKSDGGAISSGSNISIQGTHTFDGNHAALGGALGSVGGRIQLSGNITFTNNTSDYEGGAIKAVKGLTFSGDDSIITFSGNTEKNGQPNDIFTGYGGGTVAMGSVTIQDAGTYTFGGGIVSAGLDISDANVTFKNGSKTDISGAVTLVGANVTIEGSDGAFKTGSMTADTGSKLNLVYTGNTGGTLISGDLSGLPASIINIQYTGLDSGSAAVESMGANGLTISVLNNADTFNLIQNGTHTQSSSTLTGLGTVNSGDQIIVTDNAVLGAGDYLTVPASLTVKSNSLNDVRTIHRIPGETSDCFFRIPGTDSSANMLYTELNMENLILDSGTGYTPGSSELNNQGGAIQGGWFNNVTLNAENVSFTNGNTSLGGAINVYTLTLNGNTTFHGNTARQYAGAISAYYGLEINGTHTFADNSATNGGALACIFAGEISIQGTNTFTNNKASSSGGAIAAVDGGSLTFHGDNSNAVFTGNTANGKNNDINVTNSVTIKDAGTYFFGGGIVSTELAIQDSANVTFGGGSITDVDTMSVTNKANVTFNDGAKVDGAVSAKDSTLSFNGKAEITGNVTAEAESTVNFGNGANVDSDVAAKDSTLNFNGKAEIAGNVTADANSTANFNANPAGHGFTTINSNQFSGKVNANVKGFTVGALTETKGTQEGEPSTFSATLINGVNAPVSSDSGLITDAGTGNDTVVNLNQDKDGTNYGFAPVQGSELVGIDFGDAKSMEVHNFSLIVDGANSEINLNDFANWLGTETGLDTSVGTGYVSVRLETPFEIMSSDSFIWDFSGYDGIANLQFASVNMMDSTVPEPTTWALLVLGGLGIFGVARKNRKAKK